MRMTVSRISARVLVAKEGGKGREAKDEATHLGVGLLPRARELGEHLVGGDPGRARVAEARAHGVADVADEKRAEAQGHVGPRQGRLAVLAVALGGREGRRLDGRGGGGRDGCALGVEVLDLVLLLASERHEVAQVGPGDRVARDAEVERRRDGLVERRVGREGREGRVALEEQLADGEGEVEERLVDRGLLCGQRRGSSVFAGYTQPLCAGAAQQRSTRAEERS